MRKIIEQKRILDSYIKVDRCKVKDDKTGVEFYQEVCRRPRAVAAIVFDKVKHKYIFVEQFRAPRDGYLIEAVAGKIDENEDPDIAIEREIMEEIGYKVDSMKIIIPFYYVSPGPIDEQIQIYYIEVSEKTSKGGGLDSEFEDIKIIELSYSELKDYMKNNKIIDGKTLLGLYKHLSGI